MEGPTSSGGSRNRLTCLTLQEHDDDDDDDIYIHIKNSAHTSRKTLKSPLLRKPWRRKRVEHVSVTEEK